AAIAASVLRDAASSIVRSEPSLEPLHDDEYQNAHEDDKANRSVHSWKIVTLGQLVDELPETAKIDEKLHADDVDECENQAKAYADKNGRQCCRKQDFPELLRLAQLETPAHVDQHSSGAGEALEGLEDCRCEPGAEPHHDDCRGAAAED